jgi:hypothetical protein
MNGLVDARLIKLSQYVDADSDGLLVVTEAGEYVPFHQIQRMFTILAPAGAKRGRHASSALLQNRRFSSSCAIGRMKSKTTPAITPSSCHFAKPHGHEDLAPSPVSSCVPAGACIIYLEDKPVGADQCGELRLITVRPHSMG